MGRSRTKNSWAKPSLPCVVIATKFGLKLDPNGQQVVDSGPEFIKETAEGSLKRLRVETIDLFYQHRVDPAVPIEEVAGAGRGLVAHSQGENFPPLRLGGGAA